VELRIIGVGAGGVAIAGFGPGTVTSDVNHILNPNLISVHQCQDTVYYK